MINSIYQTLPNYTYRSVCGYKLKATHENLEWVLQQDRQEVLKYKFQDSCWTYSSLEFAVKCGDDFATRLLVELGADLEYSAASGMGTILHFYVDCLEENTPPNLALLNTLLDHISDINAEERSTFCVALECALQHMASYTPIHWDVIETLLERGSRITENVHTGNTPFMVLKNAHLERMHSSQEAGSFEKEQVFLDHLVRYCDLEKKYHADSECSLTLEEFKFYISGLRSKLSRFAIAMNSDAFFAHAFASLSQSIEKIDFFEKNNTLNESAFSYSIDSDHKKISEQIVNDCIEAANIFAICKGYFSSCAVKGELKDCFAAWELNAILPVMHQYLSVNQKYFLRHILNALS